MTEQLRFDDVDSLPSAAEKGLTSHTQADLAESEHDVQSDADSSNGPVRPGSDAPLYDQLMWAIREAFPGVEKRPDRNAVRRRARRHSILKLEGRTIGYVNGRGNILRIDLPRARGETKWTYVTITNPAQIPTAIKFLQRYAEEAAT